MESMKMFYICCQVFIMFVFQSSVSMYTKFSKDILMDHDVLIDANCLYDYEFLKSYFRSQLGYFRIKPSNFVLHMKDSSVMVLTCPTNRTELFQYLQSVGIVSIAKTMSPQPVYIVQWPESITCSSGRNQTLPNLQDDLILQEIVTTFPMDVDVYLSLNCQDFLGFEKNIFNAYVLIELYSIRNTVPVIQPISNDVFNHELFSEDIINKVERRSNFHGVPLVAVDYDDRPAKSFDIMQEDLMQNDLTLSIALILNISLTIINGTGWITNPCYDWGKETSDLDCPLTGMGHQILSGEADFTFTNTELVPYRVRYLKSLQPFQVTRVIAIFRQPHWSLLRNIYIKSFNPLLWLGLLITLGMIIFTAIAISNIQARIPGNLSITSEAINAQDSQYISQTILWLLSSITMQGWHISAASLPFKIIHISTLMLALVCIAVYSGTIFSILSNQKGPIKDYQDLVRFNLPVVADGRMLMAIRAAEVLNSNRRFSKNVEIRMSYNNNLVDVYETFSTTNKVLLTSKDGWLSQAFTSNIINTNELCNNFSVFLDNYGIPILTVMYMHRNSSLREFLNYPFVVLIETGLRHRLNNFDFVDKSVRCLEPEKQPEPFGNNEVFSVYMILVIGFVSSVTFLLIEKTFSFLNHRHAIRFATPLNTVSLKSLIK